MQKIGMVVETTPHYAVVEVTRSSACDGCAARTADSKVDGSACGTCTSFALFEHSGEMRTRADNAIGAHTGDRVLVETDSHTVIGYAAAVFLLPLLLGVVGYLVGTAIFHSGALPYVTSLVGFAAAFVFLYFVLDRRAGRRLDVKIVRILSIGDKSDA